MDVDNTNANVAQGAIDESSLDDQLVAAFDDIAQSLPNNGAGSDPGDGDDGDGASLEDDLDETDDGAGDPEDPETDPAESDPDPAGAGEPPQKQVKTEPPKPDYKAERRNKAIEEYAKRQGYSSVEEMIGLDTGESEAEVKARLESDELTVEEKAALYDKEHARSAEEDGKRVHDRLLSEIVTEYPSLKDTVKDLRSDIDSPEKFLKLIKEGFSAVEAFRATNFSKIPAVEKMPSGKAHLVPNVRTTRGGGSASIPVADLAILREEFPDLSDKKIEVLYKKVSS